MNQKKETQALIVKFQKVHLNAKLPSKAYSGDAGWDVYSTKKVTIPGNGSARLIPTGLKMAIPDGYFARIEGRGGFHLSTTLIHKGTPIDSGYRDEVFAIVGNTGEYPIVIEAGDKFGQLVYYPVLNIQQEETSEILVDTARGTSKLGQSDKKEKEKEQDPVV